MRSVHYTQLFMERKFFISDYYQSLAPFIQKRCSHSPHGRLYVNHCTPVSDTPKKRTYFRYLYLDTGI